MDRGQLAQMLGETHGAIDRFIRSGMPFVRQGGRGTSFQFDTADVVRWLREEDAKGRSAAGISPSITQSLAEARATQAIAQARMKEMELEERQGQLITTDVAEAHMRDAFAAARARLLELPSRLATRLATIEDPLRIERIIDAEVAEVLTEVRDHAVRELEAAA